MLIGEKAGSKKEKAQEFWLTIYEGWETLTKRFPILATLKNNDAPSNQKSPKQVYLDKRLTYKRKYI
jgi:hypothetical protein